MNDQIYTVVTIIFTLIDRPFTKCSAYIHLVENQFHQHCI